MKTGKVMSIMPNLVDEDTEKISGSNIPAGIAKGGARRRG
jgi:hypothetical protein